MHTALPYHFYVFVDNKYLGKDVPEGFTEGILHGVYACMGEQITATLFPYLDGLVGKYTKDNLKFRHTGIIIDWNDGFSRYPQEHKPLSLVALEQGNFGLLPNNYFKIYDKHFTQELDEVDVTLKKYKRGEVIYWED